MPTVANAAALLDAIEAQLGTREVAIQIIDSRWLNAPQIVDANLTGITSATIIAYSGKGVYSADYTIGAADVTAPTITSGNSASVAENATLEHVLTANETVTWSIRTAAENVLSVDYADFELNGNVLRWTGNGFKDYELPDDTGTNNTYVVVVRATDVSLNTTDQTVTITVTDVAEGGTPDPAQMDFSVNTNSMYLALLEDF